MLAEAEVMEVGDTLGGINIIEQNLNIYQGSSNSER